MPKRQYSVNSSDKPILFTKKGFVEERGSRHDDPGPIFAEDRVGDLAWYQRYFVGTDHDLFIANLEEAGAGIVVVASRKEAVEGADVQFRVVVWTEAEILRKVFTARKDMIALQHVLAECAPNIATHHKQFRRVIPTKKVEEALLTIESPDAKPVRKVGVLYVKEGQTDENEIFANQHESDVFDEFLALLGKRVELRGYTGYAAQLDTKGDIDGAISIARDDGFLGMEWMFHVSTLLRLEPKDPQQIQRKRHIGNDIVVIVFIEGNTAFDVGTLVSQYTRVIPVVQASPDMPSQYRFSVARHHGQPAFSPTPCKIFDRDKAFGEFLLAKCYNGERSTKMGEEFRNYERRTRRGLLNMLYEEWFSAHLDGSRSKRTTKPKLSPVVHRITHNSTLLPQVFQPAPAILNHPSRITCIDEADDYVVFAMAGAGLYCTKNDSLCEGISKSWHVADIPDIVQIQAAPAWDQLVVLSSSMGIIVYELGTVCCERGSAEVARCTLVIGTRGVDMFAWGSPSDGGWTSPLLLLVRGRRVEVLDGGQNYTKLQQTTSFPDPVVCCTCTPHGFVIASGCTFALCTIRRNESVISRELVSTRGKIPVAAFCHDHSLTLCYEGFGVAVHIDGAKNNFVSQSLHWSQKPQYIGASDQLLFIVGGTSTEVRSLVSGALVEEHAVVCSHPFQSCSKTPYIPTWHQHGKSASVLQLRALRPSAAKQAKTPAEDGEDGEDAPAPAPEATDSEAQLELDSNINVTREMLEENLHEIRQEAKSLEQLRRRYRRMEVELGQERRALEVEKTQFYAEQESAKEEAAHLAMTEATDVEVSRASVENVDPLKDFRFMLDSIHAYKTDANDIDSPTLLTDASACEVHYSDRIVASLYPDGSHPERSAAASDEEILRVLCGCLGGTRAYYQRYFDATFRREMYEHMMHRLLVGKDLKRFLEGGDPVSPMETAVNSGDFKRIIQLTSRGKMMARSSLNAPLKRHYKLKSRASTVPIIELTEGTVLHLAVLRCRLAGIQLLLKGGIDAELSGSWVTPEGARSGPARELARERALRQSLSEAAKFLLSSGDG